VRHKIRIVLWVGEENKAEWGPGCPGHTEWKHTLSQVDPEADTGTFDTVLNLFENPQGVSGLTAWDRSYLSALYNSPSRRRTVGGQANAVASIMNRTARAERDE